MGFSSSIALGLGFAILVLSVASLVAALSSFLLGYSEALKEAASSLEHIVSSKLVISNATVNATTLDFVVVNEGSTSIIFDDSASLIVLYYSGGIVRGSVLGYGNEWNITKVVTGTASRAVSPGSPLELLPGQKAYVHASLPQAPDTNTSLTLVIVTGKGVKSKYVTTT